MTEPFFPPLPICIVMAVFKPERDQLQAQLLSIARQTRQAEKIIIVIADCLSRSLVEDVVAAVDIPRNKIVFDTPPQELDAPRAFEAGLLRALDETGPNDLIALCDQDDIWHPKKLAECAKRLEANSCHMLVHSDARVVDRLGAVRDPSLFEFEHRLRKPNLRQLLYRNSVTGMCTMFRRRVADIALPFPPQAGVHYYHDLWIALVARAIGSIALIEMPLVDYRQHGTNTVGALLPGRPKSRFFSQAWWRQEAGHYALARYLARTLQARLSEAVQDGRLHHGGAQTRLLAPYLKRRGLGGAHMKDAFALLFSKNPTLSRIAAMHGMMCAGRCAWAFHKALGPGFYGALTEFDQKLFALSPGAAPPQIDPAGDHQRQPAKTAVSYIDGRKTMVCHPVFTSPNPAINILLPTLNPTEAFAGIATAIDLGLELASLGHMVRFITTDLPITSEAATRRFIISRIPADRSRKMVEQHIAIICGASKRGSRDSVRLPSHTDDLFLATAWWTAHIAQDLIDRHGYSIRQFIYLIQDYEPNFYPWGSTYADALATYNMDALPVFNTTLLRDFLQQKGHKIATKDALAFHPSISPKRYFQRGRTPKIRRRLAIYGRPEVDRNMFPTAIEALHLFLRCEALGPSDIELVSIGLKHEDIDFGNGNILTSIGKIPWDDYPEFLSQTDIGLSLMLSPHPSHPPLEMAASGVRVVTNNFSTKNLAAISPAIQSVSPTPKALSEALKTAWHCGPVADSDRDLNLSLLGNSLEATALALSTAIQPKRAAA